MVTSRVWIPRKINSTVEFIFVAEDQMTLYHECAVCNAYATEQCGGCRKASDSEHFVIGGRCQPGGVMFVVGSSWQAYLHGCIVLRLSNSRPWSTPAA